MKVPTIGTDGSVSWKQAAVQPKTVSFTAQDLKQFEDEGYNVKSLTPEAIGRCGAVPVEIANTPTEKLFGSTSDSKLANRIRTEYPLLYWQKKNDAKKKGLIA